MQKEEYSAFELSLGVGVYSQSAHTEILLLTDDGYSQFLLLGLHRILGDIPDTLRTSPIVRLHAKSSRVDWRTATVHHILEFRLHWPTI